MEKVQGYDEAQAITGFEALEPGGYICQIMNAKEEMSSTGKKMLVISFDICEGKEAGFYDKKFKEGTSIDRKWQGVYRQMLEGDKSAGFLKGVMTALEASNPKFKWDWDEKKLKGLKFGGLFGREQYEAQDGSLKFATKIRYIRSVESIKNNKFQTPDDKLLAKSSSEWATAPSNESFPWE